MATPVPPPIGLGSRLEGFPHAIRNVVAEATRVEASGRQVTYLNIGDPVAFGFRTPTHPDRSGRARDARRPERQYPGRVHRAVSRNGVAANTGGPRP